MTKPLARGGIVNITVPKNELIVERSVQLVAKTKEGNYQGN